MAISKVILNGETLMDVTQDTVTESQLKLNKTAHKADGTQITGTLADPVYQSKSATPTESQQVITPSSGYDALSQVTVAAISSTYVGTGIARKSAADLTTSGSSVTTPAGYYSSAVSKNVASAAQATPSISVAASTGIITATATQTAGYVAAGTKSSTYNLTTKAAATITPTESAQTIASGQYLTGVQTIAAISSTYVGTGIAKKSAADLTVNGSTVTAPVGYYSSAVSKSVSSAAQATPAIALTSSTGVITATATQTAGWVVAGTKSSSITLTTKGAATITPTEESQTIPSNRWLTGTQTIAAISSTYVGTGVTRKASATYTPTETEQTIASQQYLTGVQTIAAISSTYVGTGVAKKSAADLTVSGSTVTAPVGYYSSAVSTSVASATQATPVISVNASTGVITATATQTAGWVVAGTKSSTHNLTTKAAATYTPTEASQTIASQQYLTGAQTIAAISSTYVGSGVPTQSAITVTPGLASQTVVASGTYVTGDVTVGALSAGGGLTLSAVSRTATIQDGYYESADSAYIGWYPLTNINNRTLDHIIDLGNLESQVGYVRYTDAYSTIAATSSSVGRYAFASTNISSVSGPQTTIGFGAFMDAKNLVSAYFSNATLIQPQAFDGCTNLSDISFPSVVTINSQAFSNCLNLSSARFPSATSIYSSAFYNCTHLENVTAPNVTTISGHAFFGCQKLSSVLFSLVTSIQTSAFGHCYSLSSIAFKTATSIGTYAFISCSALSIINGTLDFPKVQSVGSHAFRFCSSLTAVTLKSATSIFSYAFANCTALSMVSLPAAVTIQTAAFSGCSALMSLYLTGSSVATLAAAAAFTGTPISVSTLTGSFGSIFVPSSLYASYIAATNWKTYSARIASI